MSRKEKLLQRFLSRPKDFTFEEAERLLNDFGFYEVSTGKTSGSALRFESDKHPVIRIRFHKPHPSNVLKPYVLELIKENLERCNLLTNDNPKYENNEQ